MAQPLPTEVQIDPGSMTADELKSKLYHSFRQKGLVDSLKSQLRTKLVNELRVSYTQDRGHSSPPSTPEAVMILDEGTLMQRAANSLVADHLRRCQYDYSLAVFLPESEMGKTKVLPVRELLGMLAIHPDSQLYRRVTENMRGYHQKGLLWQLLCELMSTRGRSYEKAVQVDNNPQHLGSIEKKLTAVDELFDQEVDGYYGSSNQGLEAKLLSLQRQMEARNKEDTTREVCRFKESEGKRIELEEREKCRQEIAKARREMESAYQAKVESLQEREQSTVERIQRHQEMVERETYSQRQSLLDELQTLKQKEAELKREADLNKRAMNLEESKRKVTEENLKIRELSLATIEETYDERYKEQIRQHDVEQQVKLAERIRDIEMRAARLSEDQTRLVQEKELLSGLKVEVKERKSRVAELELLYQQSRYEAVAVSKQNEVLSERLKDMIDYHSVKEDNAVMRQELHNAKRRLAEVVNEQKIERIRHEEALASISEKMSQPSPQIVTLQAQLQRAKSQFEQERNVLQHKESQYRSTLQEERDCNSELRRQLEDHGNHIREMNSQIADLRQTLRQTQVALSNEIYRKPATQGSTPRSPTAVFEYPVHDSTEPEDHCNDTSLQQTHMEQLLLEGSYQRVNGADNDCSDLSSLAFLEYTKARFQQLEGEAETIERNYHNIQHRVSNVHTLPISPPLHTHLLSHERDQSSLAGTQTTWSKQVSPDNGPMQPGPLVNGTSSQPIKQPEVKGAVPVAVAHVHNVPTHKGYSTLEEQQVQSHFSNISLQTKGSQSSVGSLGVSTHILPHASIMEHKPAASADMGNQLASLMPPPVSSSTTSPKGSLSANESFAELLSLKNSDSRTGSEVEEVKPENRKQRDEASRLQLEEEDQEEYEWEETRKKQDEERWMREQEAREREQTMLMQLRRQEHGPQPIKQQKAEVPDDAKTSSDQEEKKEHTDNNFQEDKPEEEGLKIDPVMQRYMQMIQDKKHKIPEDRKTSPVSSNSVAGFSVAYEVEGEEEPSSIVHVSDNSDDAFDDW